MSMSRGYKRMYEETNSTLVRYVFNHLSTLHAHSRRKWYYLSDLISQYMILVGDCVMCLVITAHQRTVYCILHQTQIRRPYFEGNFERLLTPRDRVPK